MQIGILGIGRLGLCFALNLERSGYKVVGIDVSEEYVRLLNSKALRSNEPMVSEYLRQSKEFSASSSIGRIVQEDISLVFIMVATPSMPDGSYDHSQVERVIEQLVKYGKRDKRVDLVLGCTVMPGFCDSIQKRLVEYNYFVSYNPEFISQGNIIHDQVYPDQVLIGEADEIAGETLELVYKKMCKSNFVVCRMSRVSAEIAKLATNCFLTTKIAFANSIGDLALISGAETEKVLSAIGADSRIGNKYLQYGFGFGGPCFPRDNRALNLYAKASGFNLLISEATDGVNRQHLQFQFEQYMLQYHNDAPIVFDEVTYKSGTYILEESQKLALAVKLAKAGRAVTIREKVQVIQELKDTYGTLFNYELI